MTALVFENAQGKPENLHGVTVGVAVLALDDFATDLIPSMHYLSEVATLWEVGGGSYARDTVTLSYAIESGEGVLRYASGVPTFDLAGIDPVNAVVFYKLDGVGDGAHELLFALSVAEGAGFDGWTANEPTDGLWRIGKPVHNNLDGRDAADTHPIDSITGLTAALAAAGSVALPDHGVQLILAANAVDGTGDEFTLLLADPSAAGGGIVPAGWFAGSVFDSSGIGPTFDAAGFGSFLTAVGLGAGVTVVVHQGSGWTVRSVTAATVADPWPLVAASARVTGTLYALHIFAEVVDGDLRLLNKLSAGGVLYGLTSTDMALVWAEGHVYDFPRHGGPIFLDPVDPGLYTGSVADIDQPIGDDGEPVVRGDFVLTAGDLDADGNGYISIVHPTTGQWGKVPSVGAATPSDAGSWPNAITTNQIDSGFTFWGRKSIVQFRGYRSGTTISGQPANATRPLRTGEWVVYAMGGGSGTGDVVGPASATADHFATFDGTTGKLIKDGGAKGTAAALNVAASGDAASGEVVKGNDTRLTANGEWLRTVPAALAWTGADATPSRNQNSSRWMAQYIDYVNMSTAGHWIEWQMCLDAGTWTLVMFGDTLATSGTVTLKLDGSSIGTWNQYSVGTVVGVVAEITGITVAANGLHTLRAENTADGAGGGRGGRFSAWQWKRTA